MGRATTVPVTPAVVAWAIRESGFSIDRLAEAVGLSAKALNDWSSGTSQPRLTQLRVLAAKLKRPLAVFLLPAPPISLVPAVQFRRSAASRRSALNPEERRRLREAARLQRILSWMGRELTEAIPAVPHASTSDDPTIIAQRVRARLALTVKDQVSWSSGSAALHAWRDALEDSGVSVLMLSIGENSCRGFSLWDERVPVIAINTSWNAEARIFTLFHEYGHLLTRTNSACLEGTVRRAATQSDSVERWCERFAAAVLLPSEDLRKYAERLAGPGGKWAPTLESAGRIARHFKVSLRAATLRLVELEMANWGLYSSLPPQVDRKQDLGGGAAGRTRSVVRSDQYGRRTIGLFADAVKRDLIGAGDVLDYLDIPPASLGALRTAGESSGGQV
jgi:Zn-dependent peptidase ImmA (M78 family)/DNA-binding XRE family transcriptional regulator